MNTAGKVCNSRTAVAKIPDTLLSLLCMQTFLYAELIFGYYAWQVSVIKEYYILLLSEYHYHYTL